MFNRIITFLACFFAIVAVILGFMYKVQGNELTCVRADNIALKNNADILMQQLEREHNDKMEISRKNEELEAMAKHDISFDWNYTIADTDVVRWLHENAVRLQGSRTRAD